MRAPLSSPLNALGNEVVGYTGWKVYRGYFWALGIHIGHLVIWSSTTVKHRRGYNSPNRTFNPHRYMVENHSFDPKASSLSLNLLRLYSFHHADKPCSGSEYVKDSRKEDRCGLTTLPICTSSCKQDKMQQATTSKSTSSYVGNKNDRSFVRTTAKNRSVLWWSNTIRQTMDDGKSIKRHRNGGLPVVGAQVVASQQQWHCCRLRMINVPLIFPLNFDDV